jgi:Zn-dependent protease with chaperone function
VNARATRAAKPWFSAALGAAFVALLCAGAAHADEKTDFEARIVAELAAKNPEAVTVFQKANDARDRGDAAQARELYRQVHAMAPGFDHATRRLCGAESQLGNRAEAIALCREALKLDGSTENQTALASVLGSHGAPSADLDEAQRLVDKAIARAPQKVFVQQAACGVAVAKQDLGALDRCVRALKNLAPDETSTHMYAFVLDASTGKLAAARASLDRARALGLPKDEYDRLGGMLEQATPLYERVLSIGWKVAVAWVGSFLLLLALGTALSRAALRALGTRPERVDGHPQGAEKTLRRLYRGVLWLCCAFYYLSIPLLLLLVVAGGGGIIFGFVALGTIPIKLLLIVAVITLTTVWAVVKSIFVRTKQTDPGVRLDLAEHPRLQAVLAEVAAAIGTPPVHTVFLTPGTDVAVTERTGMRGLLGGSSERCLILGAGVLRGMKVLELKAILAHEHGHFHNEDTAGGGFALAVRRSLLTMAISLARSGVAAWYNPVWMFLRAFDRVFLVVSQGASRLQEVLADRWAVRAYGADPFERGLRHVIRRSAVFGAHIDATLNEVVAEKRPLLNLYTYKPAKRDDVDEAVEKAIDREPSPYDSHPSPKDRFAWAAALAAPPREPAPDDAEPAWSLFSDRRRLEEDMTDEVRAKVLASHGVAIPRPRREAPAE